MKLLIDADSFLYKIGFAYEDVVDWGDGEIMHYSSIDKLKIKMDEMINSIINATGVDEYEIWLTSKRNFRDDNPLGYKANRTGLRKPAMFNELRDYMFDKHNAQIIDGLEADDVVVYKKTTYPDDYILVAQDKDVLYQTVGNHYNYNKNKWIEVDEFTATKFKYIQTLAGDSVDGYKGVPGIGMKKAEKILEECETEKEMWDAVVAIYVDKELTEGDAIWTMRLADMHQYNGESIILFDPSYLSV